LDAVQTWITLFFWPIVTSVYIACFIMVHLDDGINDLVYLLKKKLKERKLKKQKPTEENDDE